MDVAHRFGAGKYGIQTRALRTVHSKGSALHRYVHLSVMRLGAMRLVLLLACLVYAFTLVRLCGHGSEITLAMFYHRRRTKRMPVLLVEHDVRACALINVSLQHVQAPWPADARYFNIIAYTRFDGDVLNPL